MQFTQCQLAKYIQLNGKTVVSYLANRPHVTYLLAGVAAIWLLATVCPLVSLHVVLLDKTHVTLVTAKRLLSCKRHELTALGAEMFEMKAAAPKLFSIFK